MPTLYFDIETGSPRSLHEHGAWAYAACPDTRVWCLCFAVDDGEVQSWTSGDPVPDVSRRSPPIQPAGRSWPTASSSTAPFTSTFWWRVTAFRPCRSTSSTARCRWRWRTPIQRNWPDVLRVGNRIPEGPRRRPIDAPNGASAQKPKRRERNRLGIRCREACAANHLLRPRHSLLSRRLDPSKSCPSHSF